MACRDFPRFAGGSSILLSECFTPATVWFTATLSEFALCKLHGSPLGESTLEFANLCISSFRLCKSRLELTIFRSE